MLWQLFYNLIENSIKHGKSVTEIKVHCQTNENSLILFYEDNGVGDIVDFGEEKNKSLVEFQRAVWISEEEIEIKEKARKKKGSKPPKRGSDGKFISRKKNK